MMFQRAMAERRIANLPLQIGRHTPIGSHPLLDYLIASSETVAHGLQRLASTCGC